MRNLMVVALLAGCPPTLSEPTDGPDAVVDADGDGSPAGEDCDDAEAAVFPGADERCNGIDDDCDGRVDEGAVDRQEVWTDRDGDGYGAGTVERVCDVIDDLHVGNGDDCDDRDPKIHPDAIEICDPDNVDEDCNGRADDMDDNTSGTSKSAWYADKDGDGFGDASDEVRRCDPIRGRVADNTDCDDTDPSVNPDQGCPGGWDGLWAGRVRFDLEAPDLGISDFCAGSGRLVIEAGARVELTTEGGRPWSCSGEEAEGQVGITGSFIDEDTLEGEFDLDGERFSFTAELSEEEGLVATGIERREVEGVRVILEHDLSARPVD